MSHFIEKKNPDWQCRLRTLGLLLTFICYRYTDHIGGQKLQKLRVRFSLRVNVPVGFISLLVHSIIICVGSGNGLVPSEGKTSCIENG